MVRMKRHQSLAEHSYGVALYAARMASRLHGAAALTPEDWGQLYMWALLHDVSELDYGDVPTVTKKKFSNIDCDGEFWAERGIAEPGKHVDDEIKKLVKLADIFEAWRHYDEYGYGDTNHGQAITEQLRMSLRGKAYGLFFRGQHVWPIIQGLANECGLKLG